MMAYPIILHSKRKRAQFIAFLLTGVGSFLYIFAEG
jgi:hypothetical protein